MRRCLVLVSLVALCGLCRDAAASHLETFLTGLSSPLFITNAGDGSRRLFILEQAGVIKVLGPGASTPTVFLDITDRVLSGGERGLLGLAFHPQYAANGRFFVNYTRKDDGATVIAEYARSSDANVALTTETVLLTIAQPFANHNGGCILFGHDGFLYIGMGDGGSAFDPGNRAQNIDELLGKILRIDVDSAQPYAIPDGNPYKGATPGRDEIYAIGLRNPFRFSFDRQTGQLYVGDVGQGAREEIDIVTAGMNLGWRIFEGTQCTNLDPLCGAGGFTPPIVDYGHTGGRCAVTGGYVYRGGAAALDDGTYVFGDYCTGEIFTLRNGTMSLLFDTTMNISSFGEDEDGELYVVSLTGTIRKFVPGPRPQTALRRLPDFNHDGTSDIVWRHATAGVYAAWLMHNQTLAGTFSFGVGADWSVAGFGDIDGDGNDDIVWRSASTQAVAIWFMNGGAVARSALFGVASGWDLVGVGDLNGDGRADLVFRAVVDGTLGVWLMNGGIITGQAAFSVSEEWKLVGIGDLNGDGRQDFVWQSETDGQLTVWFMNGLSHLSTMAFGVGPGWDAVALGDLNGDKRADIVWRNRTNAQLAIWLMNGTQVLKTAVYGIGAGWSVAGVGNVNGDGNADLLWHQPSTGTLAFWFFNGTSVIGTSVFAVPTVWQPIGTP